MNLLIDALPLRRGGGVTYLQMQMSALEEVAPGLNLHTLVSPWGEFEALPGTTEIVDVRSVPRRFIYEQVRLPFRKTDVLYCPANFGPIASRAPVVLMIHDAHFYAAGLRLGGRLSASERVRVTANHLAIRRASVVIAVSESLAKDAAETLPSVAKKIRSIPCGSPVWPRGERSVSGLPDRYVLVVGSSAPHKRVEDVVTAWTRSAADSAGDVGLVIVGSMADDQIARHLSIAGTHAGSLHHLGSVANREELKWLYSNAFVYVSMSALESLSLTPLEAGSLGCPLILSDIPVHRETTMGNATFIPTGDCDELARVLTRMANQVAHKDARWLWPHSWNDNARQLVEVFTSAARHPAVASVKPRVGSA